MDDRPRTIAAKPGSPFLATAEQAVLAFLARHADREFYDRQVADETGLSRGSVNAALRSLARAGLLHAEQRGRMKFYRASLDDPRVRCLKVLLNVAGLAALVKRLSHQAQRIIMFGSAAEGRDLPSSDIDIMVLTNAPDAARRLLAVRTGRVQAVVVTPVGLAEMEQRNPAFTAQVRKGIELWNAR
jgi:DNA-binding transcriptional ArsR family regulator